MMQARRAVESRIRARSSSWRTISRTSSSVVTSPAPRFASTDIIDLLPAPAPTGSSAVDPDEVEHARVGPGLTSTLHLHHVPIVLQARPAQRRAIRTRPEVARLGLTPAANDRHVPLVRDPERRPVHLPPAMQLLPSSPIEGLEEHAEHVHQPAGGGTGHPGRLALDGPQPAPADQAAPLVEPAG